jgi:formylmethanofuran dehydrogenase subunit E
LKVKATWFEIGSGLVCRYSMTMKVIHHTLVTLALLAPMTGHAETKDEWITLGARIHGAFGPFIPVGIRIGLDAMDKLKPAGPREIAVVYYNGTRPPCPCVADGVMLATHTSPGQDSLQISPEKAPDGTMAVIVITNKKTGEALRYSITDEWLPKILAWIKSDPSLRYDSAMGAEGLFQVESVK